MIFALASLGSASAAFYSNTTSLGSATSYTTISVAEPSTFEYGSTTYYVTKPTTLTLKDCGDTIHSIKPSTTSTSHSWEATAVPSALVDSASPTKTADISTTTTESITDYVTIPCSSTTLTYGSSTYTVTEATTLTLKDCSCTDNSKLSGTSSVLATADISSKTVPTSATSKPTTTTALVTDYVTIPCSSTTLTYGSGTYTVSLATTLTLKDCSCTDNTMLSSYSAPTTTFIGTSAKATETDKVTDYITIPCSSTTFTYGSGTYTVSDLTTLTVKDCSCTDTPPLGAYTTKLSSSTVNAPTVKVSAVSSSLPSIETSSTGQVTTSTSTSAAASVSDVAISSTPSLVGGASSSIVPSIAANGATIIKAGAIANIVAVVINFI